MDVEIENAIIPPMKISVIIPTYNGAHRILNVLRSLEKQSVMPNEVVVVIDGSTDGTAEKLHKEQFNLPGFKIIEQENKGRAMVRNRGAKEASGELLLFIDDDMIAPQDWVKNHVDHHYQHDQSILTGKLDSVEKDFTTDFISFRYKKHLRWAVQNEHEQAESYKQMHPYITANNLSMHSGVFWKLEGFDERLRDAEDYDMARRAMEGGIDVYFSNKAVNWNNDQENITCFKTIKRYREYGHAQRILKELKPELYGSAHKYANDPPKGMKGFIFRFFCKRFWIDSVDRETWTWLPEVIRYKLYDVIITANGSFFPEIVKL